MSRRPLAFALVLAAAAAAPAGAQVTTSSAGGEVARPTLALPVLREPVAEMYTDAKIAAVASVSNLNEIQPSQVALTKAQNANVRRYAQRMVDEHTKLEARAQAMLKQKGLTAEHNGFSYQVYQNLGATLQMLNGVGGAEFDKMYMDQQVSSHLNTLNALDTTLIPNVKDPQMKAMLVGTVRPAVVAHLKEAQGLRDQVAQGGMGGAPAGR